jgi:hypothetical protein
LDGQNRGQTKSDDTLGSLVVAAVTVDEQYNNLMNEPGRTTDAMKMTPRPANLGRKFSGSENGNECCKSLDQNVAE